MQMCMEVFSPQNGFWHLKGLLSIPKGYFPKKLRCHSERNVVCSFEMSERIQLLLPFSTLWSFRINSAVKSWQFAYAYYKVLEKIFCFGICTLFENEFQTEIKTAGKYETNIYNGVWNDVKSAENLFIGNLFLLTHLLKWYLFISNKPFYKLRWMLHPSSVINYSFL